MDEVSKQFEGPNLSNSDVTKPTEDNPSFRNPIPSTITSQMAVPPPGLPPRPQINMQPNYGVNAGYVGGMGTYGTTGYGYGMSSYGGYGMNSMPGMGPYGTFNRFGPLHGDIESRFIQMAEESSRPAFESIHSLVNAVASISMMLENTFFALTSSFRAILGVAENFGRLRSLFAQFWSTFTVLRSFNWLIKKILVILGIRTEAEFKAWAEAVAATQNGTATPQQQSRGSSWPILLFFGVIAAAPYIVLRMLNGLTSSINERLNDPTTWQEPLRAVAQYDFVASSPQELSFNANQIITLAPQHLQGNLWNSGWLMGSVNRQQAGLVPITYIKVVKANKNTSHNDSSKAPEDPTMTDFEKYYPQGKEF